MDDFIYTQAEYYQFSIIYDVYSLWIKLFPLQFISDHMIV